MKILPQPKLQLSGLTARTSKESLLKCHSPPEGQNSPRGEEEAEEGEEEEVSEEGVVSVGAVEEAGLTLMSRGETGLVPTALVVT